MKRIAIVIALVASYLAAAPATAQDPLAFVFEGAGWGHGVGFSQWGARGQALTEPDMAGEDIAAYYFTGSEPMSLTELSLESDVLDTVDNPVWVNLDSEVTELTFTAVGGPLDLCLANDGEGDCPKPEHPQAGETWTFERLSAGECAFFRDGVQQGNAGDCRASIAWPDADGVRLAGQSVCEVSGSAVCEYHHGELKLRDDPADVGFHVVLAIGLEDYLLGIRELPDDWSGEGVNEAQAVASRSYGAYRFFVHEGEGVRTENDPGIDDARKDQCWCHLYDDTRDQYYVGWDKEVDHPEWVAAVAATEGRVLSYTGDGASTYTQGGIIQAFYFASSGGWTESNVDGFATTVDGVVNNPQWPYLHPVEDAWAVEPTLGNPNDAWIEEVEAATIAGLLGWDDVTAAVLVAERPGATVHFSGTDEGEPVATTIRGQWLRNSLGLPSASITAIDGVGGGPPPVFTDIGGSVHQPAILQIYEAGITTGCQTGLYCPGDPVTRAQMASFIARALELPDPVGDHFGDDGGSVHERAINQLFEAGITLGCEDGRYCPNDHLTREQMAAFLARALELEPVEDDPFTDDDDSPYEGEINAIAAAGITTGCEVSLYCPDDPVTRAQMASFLARGFLDET